MTWAQMTVLGLTFQPSLLTTQTHLRWRSDASCLRSAVPFRVCIPSPQSAISFYFCVQTPQCLQGTASRTHGGYQNSGMLRSMADPLYPWIPHLQIWRTSCTYIEKDAGVSDCTHGPVQFTPELFRVSAVDLYPSLKLSSR